MFVRWMTDRDIAEAAKIEAMSFGDDAFTGADISALRRQARTWCFVVESGAKVVGHMVFEQLTTRTILHTLAVHPSYRRCGFGRAMLEKYAEKSRRRTATVYVPEQLLEAQLFFRDCGYRAVRVESKDNGVDYVMELVVEEAVRCL